MKKIKKYADGGDVARWDNLSIPLPDVNNVLPATEIHSKRSPEQQEALLQALRQQNAANDAAMRQQHPPEPEEDVSGYRTYKNGQFQDEEEPQSHAHGGEIERFSKTRKLFKRK
jgi:hypothetical protein